MSLKLSNAVVSVYSGKTGVATLQSIPAMIDHPTQTQNARFGGQVRYQVGIGPLFDYNDCLDGDTLRIESWGANSVDPNRQWYIFESLPEGGAGLEIQLLLISNRRLTG